MKEVTDATPKIQAVMNLINQCVTEDQPEFKRYVISINFSAKRNGKNVEVKDVNLKEAVLEPSSGNDLEGDDV